MGKRKSRMWATTPDEAEANNLVKQSEVLRQNITCTADEVEARRLLRRANYVRQGHLKKSAAFKEYILNEMDSTYYEEKNQHTFNIPPDHAILLHEQEKNPRLKHMGKCLELIVLQVSEFDDFRSASYKYNPDGPTVVVVKLGDPDAPHSPAGRGGVSNAMANMTEAEDLDIEHEWGVNLIEDAKAVADFYWEGNRRFEKTLKVMEHNLWNEDRTEGQQDTDSKHYHELECVKEELDRDVDPILGTKIGLTWEKIEKAGQSADRIHALCAFAVAGRAQAFRREFSEHDCITYADSEYIAELFECDCAYDCDSCIKKAEDEAREAREARKAREEEAKKDNYHGPSSRDRWFP